MINQEADILQEILRIQSWFEKTDCNYYSINSLPKNRAVDSLIAKHTWFGVIWRQLFRISPINFRHILGHKGSERNPKAVILLALAYIEIWSHYKHAKFLDDFDSCAKWILSRRSKSVNGFAIPQLKEVIVRGYKANEDDISPFLTYWAGLVFLRAFEYLGDEMYLELADNAALYFVKELPRIEDKGLVYFYYVPNHGDYVRCYNCSALVSSYLVMIGKILRNATYSGYGRKGIQYIVSVQREDGSWFYGNSRDSRYIDNFHTAFILIALYQAKKYYTNDELERSFERGLRYYENKLFKKIGDGMICRPVHFEPRYLPRNSNLIQKVDLRDAALSIILFSLLSQEHKKYSEYAGSILGWTMENMKGRNGYFCELTWLWANNLPYVEFQAWMILALTTYVKCLSKADVYDQ
jgi:hypothetical protein